MGMREEVILGLEEEVVERARVALDWLEHEVGT